MDNDTEFVFCEMISEFIDTHPDMEVISFEMDGVQLKVETKRNGKFTYRPRLSCSKGMVAGRYDFASKKFVVSDKIR